MKYILLCLLSIAFLFSSCYTSIEIVKRKYRPGFFVDISSHGNNSVLVNSNYKNKINFKPPEEIKIPTYGINNINALTNEKLIAKETVLASNDHKLKSGLIKIKSHEKKSSPVFAFTGFTEENPPGKHVPTSAVLAFVFGVFSILSLILLGLPDIYFFTIFPILLIITFIFSLTALKKIKNNSTLKGKSYAMFGFIISLLGFISIIVASILVLSSI